MAITSQGSAASYVNRVTIRVYEIEINYVEQSNESILKTIECDSYDGTFENLVPH